MLAWLILDRVRPTNPLRDALTRVVAPLQYATAQGARPARQFWAGLTSMAALGRENEELKQQVAELRSQVALLQEAQIENETLRRQLDFKSSVPSLRLLSAEVIGHDPSGLQQYLIIDRGAEDGVALAMPVLADAGLVGRISEVSANSAKVMLISDPSSSVSAIVQRTRATGIVRGSVSGQLTMYYLPPGESVAPGDVVLTSGLGGNFPRRLVIGQVASVSHADVDMFQEAEVVAPLALRDLEQVMVLLNLADYELAQPEDRPATKPSVGTDVAPEAGLDPTPTAEPTLAPTAAPDAEADVE
jgi:rod shape-determining protein MreC